MEIEITNRQLEIIDAVGRILTESGVSGLTIKRLAKEMNFSESAIYRHFESKEDILVLMLNYLAFDIDKRFQEVVSNEVDVEMVFLNLFKSQIKFFVENPHFVIAIFAEGLFEESEKINQSILNLMFILRKYLMPIIIKGQAKNVIISTISAEDLMHIIMGSFRLLSLKWRISKFSFEIENEGDRLLENLLILIKTK